MIKSVRTELKPEKRLIMERLKVENLYDLSHTLAKPLLEKVEFPWQALNKIKDFVLELGKTLDPEKFDKIGEDIWIAKSVTVAKTATLIGPLIIDEDTEVRPGAFIRGSVLVGKNCVVGNSTELKNCILFDNVQVPHYNYVGDSIYGFKSHTGAGVIASNLKSDKSLVTVTIDGVRVETRVKKFGAMIGDFVEVGCNSVMNPGTVIGRHSSVYPLSFVRGFVPENTIYKRLGEVADRHE